MGENHSHESKSIPTGACKSNSKMLRVLALHGSEGTAASFEDRVMNDWRQAWHMVHHQEQSSDHVANMQVTALNAPHPQGQGYCWWTMPPGIRSFQAESYSGFDASEALVLQAIQLQQKPSDETAAAVWDVVMGHSQGAILLTALLALRRLPIRYHHHHPSVGYILNGVAWPNPYTEQLESLQWSDQQQEQQLLQPAPRILIIIGEKDRINPPQQGQRVAQALIKAGYDVTILWHVGGHSVPTSMRPDNTTLQCIFNWIKQGLVR